MIPGTSVPIQGRVISTDQIERARSVQIEDEIVRRGITLRGRTERCGPCPLCGGHDRFSINIDKQLWNCRDCCVGGDIIALVQHLDGYRVTTGYFPSGGLAEVFVSNHKAGNASDLAAGDAGILVSLLLQYGCPVEVFAKTLSRNSFGSASGVAFAVVDRIMALK
jgi:hypothetical protein